MVIISPKESDISPIFKEWFSARFYKKPFISEKYSFLSKPLNKIISKYESSDDIVT